jgi:hypothetical protein
VCVQFWIAGGPTKSTPPDVAAASCHHMSGPSTGITATWRCSRQPTVYIAPKGPTAALSIPHHMLLTAMPTVTTVSKSAVNHHHYHQAHTHDTATSSSTHTRRYKPNWACTALPKQQVMQHRHDAGPGCPVKELQQQALAAQGWPHTRCNAMHGSPEALLLQCSWRPQPLPPTSPTTYSLTTDAPGLR